MHHCTTSKIQRAVSSQQAAAPHHVRNRDIREREPHHDKNQYRRKTNTLRQRADNQPDGNTGERSLKRDMNILINRPRYRRQRDILQHRPIGITEKMIPFAKSQRIAVHHP
ncbi:Uncharacterised protein [Salmonella enterica subsp. enterica serovar Bovismorbificans]|uniref:Uncharacterized protein n=1 Tax=Salmonella enterica subsp. enterica serovar Bovismorbificans TaxID=58097 RepID=A0A655DQA9_SALET|nr:Uncharacterised protein [Salmonella enterica subsp. enterica serovar Bovismorbificans]CNU78598.1 Uncharacterised protein [Salmonella enterica subsp. enterica serovar Bovismorbificans]CPR49168.1 Uncharacterised protein [Salmonella enterica subsp. enterica serovar Bovismorbificans]CQB65460.1 Uncharacterised protein [Salmonella enterica subsp. enterica serovar Bovismorbificans]